VRLLVANDDLLLSERLHKFLSKERFASDFVSTEGQLLDAAGSQDYDLLIYGFCTSIENSLLALRRFLNQFENLPVIVISRHRKVRDRIRFLNMGADDFLAKPFHMQELAAKVRAALRRMPTRAQTGMVTSVGPIRLFPQLLTATLDEQPVALTHHEYRLLEVLIRKRDLVLSRTQLEDSLYEWGEEVGSNMVEVYVHQLRRKLRPDVINTIRGVGYQLSPSLWN
jgi:DNA-binding response OmpR family regulator